MKKLFLTAALAVAVASPALAASSQHVRHGATVNSSFAAQNTVDPAYAIDGAYAYAADLDTVVADGKVLGRDPDVFIRQSLLRQGDAGELAGN